MTDFVPDKLPMDKVAMDKMTLDPAWSYSHAYQALGVSAKFKLDPEDFIVEENNSVEFSGEGEHCWLYIKKQNCNTDWVAQQLSKYCGVKANTVSYAGLKDRHAVTSQWFSVQLPGLPTPQWSEFELALSADDSLTNLHTEHFQSELAQSKLLRSERVQVLKCFRHNRKLQRGALKSNSFKITLRNLSSINGEVNDKVFASLEQRCKHIAQKGVPNYFGPQRFGRGFNNLSQAEKMFSNPGFSKKNRLSRQKRGLYLSAARSWMFNRILSERVDDNVWHKRLAGDVFMLEGKSACFKDEADNVEQLNARLNQNEIHPTAVLWGDGEPMVTAQAEELESKIVNQFPIYRDGLKSARVQLQRRACRIIPADLVCSRSANNFVVSFSLPPGSYATVVLGEMFSQLTGAE